MKNLKFLRNTLILAVGLFAYQSCDENDNLYPQLTVEPLSITEIIDEDSSLSTLSASLSQVGLDSMFALTTTYTFFAPNDDAFGNVTLEATTDEEVENILLNHALSTVTADFISKFETGYYHTLGTGPLGLNLSLYINNANSAIFNGKAELVAGAYDKGATNGVMHTVNAVLLPPTLTDHVFANPDYTSLYEALVLTELDKVLAAADGLYTLFSPNNVAFDALMMELNGAFGWETLEDVPVEVLTEVLLYHAVASENLTSPEVDGKDLATVQGEIISISGTTIKDASYTLANIDLLDVQGINGIMHGIDKVLLPEDVFQSILGATLNIAERCEDKGYTEFIKATDKTGLTARLTEDELTAFVPNNDAFALFFIGIDNYGSLDDFQSDEDLALLKSLLEYHLYEGRLLEEDMTDGETIATVYGDDIEIEKGSSIKLVPSLEDGGKGEIVNTNIGASNGVIQEISKVLIPKDLAQALGVAGAGGLLPVADDAFVYFNFNGEGFDSWWGDVPGNPRSDAAASADGTPFFDASNVQGGGWTGMFFRNSGNNFTPAAIGTDIDAYEFKFDINVKAPTSGVIKFRFQGTIGDVFFDWDISQIDEAGWVTVVLPANILGVSDFSLVDGEFGAAYSGDSMLNFSIDNVRFEEVGSKLEPVADDAYEYFNFNGEGYDSWWGDVPDNPVSDAAASADGTPFFGATGVQGSGWTGMFFRNSGDNFAPAAIGTDIDNYVLKFDINVLENFSDGVIKFRFQGSIGDVFYDWDATQIEGGSGWQTVSIPASALGVSDFSLVDGEFGAAYSGSSVLNFSMDNLRFESK